MMYFLENIAIFDFVAQSEYLWSALRRFWNIEIYIVYLERALKYDIIFP